MSGLDDIKELYEDSSKKIPLDEIPENSSQRYSPQKRSKYSIPLIAATLCLGTIIWAGDGSDEPGFVAPPTNRPAIPAPPRTISSAETTDPCCCCPVTPQARTEAKKPPQPPTLITKLKD